MRVSKTKRLLLIAAALFLTGLIVFIWKELSGLPSFEGKSIRYWFGKYYASGGPHSDGGAYEEAAFALRSMGTNAVPYLVEQFFSTRQDSAFRSNILSVLDDVALPWERRGFVSLEGIREQAGSALFEIKPPAKMVLPSVINALNSTNAARRWSALYLLGGIGDGAEDAMPLLREALRDKDFFIRAAAIHSISSIGPRAKTALPELIDLLRKRSWALGEILAVGNMGPDAWAAIPELNSIIRSTVGRDRMAATVALCQIDPEHSEAREVLMKSVLVKGDPKLREMTIGAISQLTRPNPVFLPVLAAAIKETQQDTFIAQIAYTLEKISRELAMQAWLEVLNRSPTNGSPTSTRNWAAGSLVRLDPNHPLGLSVLIDSLTNQTWRFIAIGYLGRASPDAKQVMSALQKLSCEDEQPWIRRAAEKAIRRINRRASTQSVTSLPNPKQREP